MLSKNVTAAVLALGIFCVLVQLYFLFTIPQVRTRSCEGLRVDKSGTLVCEFFLDTEQGQILLIEKK